MDGGSGRLTLSRPNCRHAAVDLPYFSEVKL